MYSPSRLDAVEAGKRYIEQRDIWSRVSGELHRLERVSETANYLQIGLRPKERLQSVAHDGMVVEKENLNSHVRRASLPRAACRGRGIPRGAYPQALLRARASQAAPILHAAPGARLPDRRSRVRHPPPPVEWLRHARRSTR